MKKYIFSLLLGVFISASCYGQVGINNSLPNATLDITAKNTDGSTSEGTIHPRLTGEALHTADQNNVYGVNQDGAIVFVTSPPSVGNRVGQTVDIDSRGYYYYDFPENKWIKILYGSKGAVVNTLDCSGSTTSGTLTQGQSAANVISQIPYTGGNGGTYFSQAVSSTGVSGLTASISSGTLGQGPGTLYYSISGTPSSSGTATFPIVFGGQSCNLSLSVGSNSAVVTALNCAGGSTTGSVTSDLPASGVSRTVPYTGGNGVSYSAQNVSSTGVTGLTANLSAGTLATGSGTLTYTISGIPSGSGTAAFSVVFGGQSCSFSVSVGNALAAGSGSLSGKTCFDVVMVNDGGDCGTLSSRLSQKADFSQSATNTQAYTFIPTGTVSNVRFVYVNTNGQVINSISGGNSGNNITGAVNASVSYNTNLNSLASGTTRSNALTARIIVIYNDNANNTGTDKQLVLNVNVQDCSCCGAYVAPGVWKEFMCQNLGADTSVDPFTPSALIQGAKYQWGATTGMAGRYYSQTQDQGNSGVISGWNTTVLPNNTWQDAVKTASDPCPSGYRVPTQAQWQGVINNNTITRTGSWANSPTNYTTAIKFGTALLLPAAGNRSNTDGTLSSRGNGGYYWSSSPSTSPNAGYLYFNSSSASITNFNSTSGFSVRCISE
ncbi:FISUMP domain-containing protein [Chryseobacterium sp. EO14]|uniref:FISUMP domain-containing protein n=1 Tax=Chryseobacterium sp. EO14 TaxID=2950551 RepID=UPI002108B07C|nr:FISUMP domain-containing protein [Chryseobacterium sp. EO14]MCQ4142368.1 hypothetical protein [Chryseobacterium sp. EO14]